MTLTVRALLALSVAAAFVAVLFAMYALASAPAHASARLGLRGFKRVRSLEQNGAWAQIEPLVRWLAARVSPLVRGQLRDKLDRDIMLAGDFWGLTPEEYVGLSLLSGLGGLFAGSALTALLHKPAIWTVLAASLGALLPYFHLTGTAHDRIERIQNSLPYLIDLLSLSLSAGLDFPGALRQVVDKTSDADDPIMEEVGYILQELQIGKTRKQALIEFRNRVPGESVNEFVAAIVQAEERGNPLAEVLTIQATTSRQRRSVRGEEAAAKAGIKLIGPALMVFAACIIIIVGPLFFELGPLIDG
jgi:tight adherence protein C